MKLKETKRKKDDGTSLWRLNDMTNFLISLIDKYPIESKKIAEPEKYIIHYKAKNGGAVMSCSAIESYSWKIDLVKVSYDVIKQEFTIYDDNIPYTSTKIYEDACSKIEELVKQ